MSNKTRPMATVPHVRALRKRVADLEAALTVVFDEQDKVRQQIERVFGPPDATLTVSELVARLIERVRYGRTG